MAPQPTATNKPANCPDSGPGTADPGCYPFFTVYDIQGFAGASVDNSLAPGMGDLGHGGAGGAGQMTRERKAAGLVRFPSLLFRRLPHSYYIHDELHKDTNSGKTYKT